MKKYIKMALEIKYLITGFIIVNASFGVLESLFNIDVGFINIKDSGQLITIIIIYHLAGLLGYGMVLDFVSNDLIKK